MNHLDIWEKVKTTDPAFTKEFNRGGGFKGTAINPTYNCRKATEVFGPCGIGWGYEILNEEILPGAKLTDDVFELIHIIKIKLWYKIEEQRGEITHYGATTFVGKNKNGFFTDEEVKKKSLTDAISKALSMLGFSADIHTGLYDDNKYVNDLRAKIENQKTIEIENKKKEILRIIGTLSTVDEIKDHFKLSMNDLGITQADKEYRDWWINVFSPATKKLTVPTTENQPVTSTEKSTVTETESA